MQHFVPKDDLISMRGEGIVGLPVPADLQHIESAQLFFDGQNLLDASTVTDWLIDDSGSKRHPAMHGGKGWQAINCDFDDNLVLDTGQWRVETNADRFAQAKIVLIAGAVQAADSFTSSILAKYPAAEKAGWPQKQAECGIIIAADDASTSITEALNKTVLMKTIATAASWDNAATVLAARAIIAKANEFAAIAAMVEVMRNTADATINAASDWDELETAKTSLTQQAQALAEQYGLA